MSIGSRKFALHRSCVDGSTTPDRLNASAGGSGEEKWVIVVARGHSTVMRSVVVEGFAPMWRRKPAQGKLALRVPPWECSQTIKFCPVRAGEPCNHCLCNASLRKSESKRVNSMAKSIVDGSLALSGQL
jgi:hypothetical protein